MYALALFACIQDPPKDDGSGHDLDDTAVDSGDTGAPDDSGETAEETGETAQETAEETGDSGEDTATDTGEDLFLATWADWSAGTGTYSAWGWPSMTPIVAGAALPARDTHIDCDSDRIFLFGRNTGTEDFIAQMDPTTATLGDTWTLDVDANPWDIDLIDGLYWVSLMNEARIDLYDGDGNVVETLDMTPYADSDGTAQPAATQEHGDYTYVVLAGYDETREAYGTPQLLQIETATRAVNWQIELEGHFVAGVGSVEGDEMILQVSATMEINPETHEMERRLDGGIEVIDLTGPTSSGLAYTEEEQNATFDAFRMIAGTRTGWLLLTDQATGIQTLELLDIDTWTRTPVLTITDTTVMGFGPQEDGTFWNMETETDSGTGATSTDYVHRDADWTELSRIELGENLYSLQTCAL